MISLKDCTAQESLTYFEEPAVLRGTRPRKKALRKKDRRAKTVRNRPFYDPDEVEFELEDQEFLDDELVSLEEFDSILNKTKGPLGKQNCDEEDFRSVEALREDSPHPVGSGRRKKVQRRRQIDPTTCERDYTTDEVEFMTALDEYKRNSGRMFPTCSEILEVLRGLGYAKAAPAAQEQAVVEEPVTIIDETQTLTLTVDNFASEIPPTITAIGVEYNENNQTFFPFFVNDFFPVVEMSTLPDGFTV